MSSPSGVRTCQFFEPTKRTLEEEVASQGSPMEKASKKRGANGALLAWERVVDGRKSVEGGDAGRGGGGAPFLIYLEGGGEGEGTFHLRKDCYYNFAYLPAMKYSSSLQIFRVARFELGNQGRFIGNCIGYNTANFAMVVPCKTGLRGSQTSNGSSYEEVIAFSEDGRIKKALETLRYMEHGGFGVDSKTYAPLLQSCSNMKLLEEGRQVHDSIIKNGFEIDIFMGNNLISMYAKCGSLVCARKVFDKMSQRDAISWTGLIAGYAQHGHGEEAVKLFIEMQRVGLKPDMFTISVTLKACASIAGLEQGKQVHSHIFKVEFEVGVFVESALVDMYVKCGSVGCARQVFDKMSKLNVVSWTAMIAGYAWNGEALKLFYQMQRSGTWPDASIFSTVVTVCANLTSLKFGKQVHSQTIKAGYESNVCLGSALVDMYAKCRSLEDARHLFDTIPTRNLVSWTAIIAGYAQNKHGEEALKLFCQMQQVDIKPNRLTMAGVLSACASSEVLEEGKQAHAYVIKNRFELDLYVGTAIVDMYAKLKRIEDASKVFNRMPEQDLVLWTAMVAGYAQNGQGEKALKMFCQMQRAGMKPNQFAFASVLRACTGLTALEQGKQVHAHIIRSGYKSDVCVGSTLIDMYAKCGSIVDARTVFDKMDMQNEISWTALIVGCAQHGLGKEALQLFEQMQMVGMKPDHVTFVGVLSACSHAGLVDEGRHFFSSMNRDHGVSPRIEHYVCMVDLFARAGCLDEAECFIKAMPFEPGALVWQTLLSACRIQGNLELGERVAGYLLKSEPQEAVTYVLLSNIYAASGRWDGVAKVRKMMKDRKVNKDPGSSWIEVKNRDAGYVPDTNFMLHGVEQEQKGYSVFYQCQRLAIAFGLHNIPLEQVSESSRIVEFLVTVILQSSKMDIRPGVKALLVGFIGDAKWRCSQSNWPLSLLVNFTIHVDVMDRDSVKDSLLFEGLEFLVLCSPATGKMGLWLSNVCCRPLGKIKNTLVTECEALRTEGTWFLIFEIASLCGCMVCGIKNFCRRSFSHSFALGLCAAKNFPGSIPFHVPDNPIGMKGKILLLNPTSLPESFGKLLKIPHTIHHPKPFWMPTFCPMNIGLTQIANPLLKVQIQPCLQSQ
eukprot:Gb_06370 [translate_table: standard]